MNPELNIELKETARRFSFGKFIDSYGSECSIQKSSSAMEDKIWLGVDNANPQIMSADARRLGLNTKEENGWCPYEIPKEVLLSTRMHLTRDQVAALLPLLTHFVETGELP